MHDISKRDQFLMKLRGGFVAIMSNLMNREPVPLLDIYVEELLKEAKTTHYIGCLGLESSKCYPITIAYATQGRFKGERYG